MDEFEMGDMARERREKIREEFESAYDMTDLGNHDLEQLNTLYGKLDSKLSSEINADNRAVLKDMLDRVKRRRATLASDTHRAPGKADRLREIRSELEKKYGYYKLQGTRDIHLLDTAIARIEQDVSTEEDPIRSRAMGLILDRLVNRRAIITYSEPADTSGIRVDGEPAPHTPTLPRVDTDLLSEKSRAWREKNRKVTLQSAGGSSEAPAISFLDGICSRVGIPAPVYPEDLVFDGSTYRGDPRSGLLYKIVNGRQVLVWDGNGFTDTSDGRTFRSMILGFRTEPDVPSGSPLLDEAEKVSEELKDLGSKIPYNSDADIQARIANRYKVIQERAEEEEARKKAKLDKIEGKKPKGGLDPVDVPDSGTTDQPHLPSQRPTVIEDRVKKDNEDFDKELEAFIRAEKAKKDKGAGTSDTGTQMTPEPSTSDYLADNRFLSENQKRLIMGVLDNGIVPDERDIHESERYDTYFEYDGKSIGNRIEIARLKMQRGMADATGAERGLKNALDDAIDKCTKANNNVERFKKKLKDAMSPEQRQDLERLEKTPEYKNALEKLKILEDQANSTIAEINDTGKLERFKRFVKENKVGLLGITIGIASIITTIVIGSRKAIAAGARGLGKFGKAVASFGKKVWPVLEPVFKALATIIGWGAKGIAWLASNLWAVAILIAIALFNYVRERANKTNSRRK